MTRPTGSPKYGTTRKNTQRYYTTKRLIRYIYPQDEPKTQAMIGKRAIKKWRIFGQINVIACVNYLNLQRLLTLNNLLICLALARETLKDINTFEPNSDGNGKKNVP